MLSVVRTGFSNLFIMQDSACFKKPGEMKEDGFKKCDEKGRKEVFKIQYTYLQRSNEFALVQKAYS
jgi:hypothetical protein